MNRTDFGRTVVALLFLLAVIGGTAATLAAQAQQPPQQQQNEFVPIKDLPQAQREQLPAAPLVMAAYAFVWVALLVYVWSVSRRVGAVQHELADLRKRTERKA